MFISNLWASDFHSFHSSIWMPDYYLTFHMTKTELIISPILIPTITITSCPIQVNCTPIRSADQKPWHHNHIVYFNFSKTLINAWNNLFVHIFFSDSIRISDFAQQKWKLFCSPLRFQHLKQCLIYSRYSKNSYWLILARLMVSLSYFRIFNNILKNVMWL